MMTSYSNISRVVTCLPSLSMLVLLMLFAGAMFSQPSQADVTLPLNAQQAINAPSEGSETISSQLTLDSAIIASAHIAGENTIWALGTFDDQYGEFDTDPHGEPDVIDYTIGNPITQFPGTLGADIGSERSVINIYFNANITDGAVLTIRWSPGEVAPEQFKVEIDGQFVGNSLYLEGQIPAEWVTEEFTIPSTSGSSHVLTLSHLLPVEYGHGLWLDALVLEYAGPVPAAASPYLWSVYK